MAKVSPPSPPYVGPARFHGGSQSLKPCRRIVIHCTVSPCKPGGARAIGVYFRKTVTRASSAHYVVDPEETVQVVGDHQVAYHAPPNDNAIGVELCDMQGKDQKRWGDDNHRRMLARAAKLVARLCLAYDVPLVKLTPAQLRDGRRGVCGHVDVSNAWRQTSHVDPGDGFPWSTFMDSVRREAKRIANPPSDAKPKPKPKPIKPKPRTGGTAVRIVTANICNLPDMSREQVRHDLNLAQTMGGIIGWQEIAEDDDVDDLRSELKSYAHLHTETECPISVLDGRWEVTDAGKIKLHGGKKAVSPTRVATWAEIRRTGADLPPFVFVNTHWVSGAWGHPGQAAEEWRAARWAESHDKLSALVQGFLARGLTCVGGGDFNRTGSWAGFAIGHRWLLHGGFDHLWACEAKGGMQVVEDETKTISTDRLFTDHAARAARVYLDKPAA